jgi:MFS family permease
VGPSPWVVLSAAVSLQALTGPGQTVGVSVFVDHLVADLELSRSVVSAAYLVGTLAGGASMPAAGRLIDRRGLRWAATWFGAAFGGMLVAMGGVTGFITLLIGFAGTRALGQGALTLTASTTVAVWFERRRGVAMGVMTAVGGALMALVPVAAAASITAVGWRTTWVLLGLVVWVLILPVARLGIADPRLPVAVDDAVDSDVEPQAESSSTAQVLRDPMFWVMTAAVSLAALIGTGLMFHHIALLSGRGLTTTEAAANFVPQTVAGAFAALGAGRLADRLSGRVTLPAAMALLAAAPLAAQVARPGITAVVYAVLLGAAATSMRTIEATLVPRWYGTASIGEIRGIVLAATVAASAVGPLALAVVHDALDTYTPVLWAFTVAPGLLALAAVIAPTPNHPTRSGPVSGWRIGVLKR